MKIISAINIIIGIWWGVLYVIMFCIFRSGGAISEPNALTATIELVIASILTCWFLWQIPYWIIKCGKTKLYRN